MTDSLNAIDCPDCGNPMLWKSLERHRCPKCTPLPEDDPAERSDPIGLLHLLADIRAAAGDREGKLMQSELVNHIADLRKKAEAAKMLPNYWDATVDALCTAADTRNLPDDDAVSIGVWDKTATPKNFHAIIRYNVGDFRALKEEIVQPQPHSSEEQ